LILLIKFSLVKNNIRIIGFSSAIIISVISFVRSSFILHAAALKFKGKGYLFIGESEAGKTTVSRIVLKNLKTAKIVSDDQILIGFEKNGFYAYRLPYRNKFIAINRTINRIKINRIFFLNKAKKNRLKRKDGMSAMFEVVSRHYKGESWVPWNFIHDFPVLVFKLFKYCIPEKLYFKKDKGFIDIIMN